MTQRKAYIITDADGKVGYGHLMRCLSISQAFRESGVVSTFLLRGDTAAANLLEGYDHEVFDWLACQDRLHSRIASADIVVIDSYRPAVDFYAAVAASVKAPVFIDDNKRIDYPRGIVLNGNIFAEDLDYPHRAGVQYLLGTAYTPLRRPFWTGGVRETRSVMEQALVIMGGGDLRDLTPSIVGRISETFPALKKDVVVGRPPSLDERAAMERDGRTRFFCNVDAEKMKELMCAADIAISAGGQTLYELALMGVPAVAVSVADNQVANVRKWRESGFLDDAGPWASDTLLGNIERSVRGLQDAGERRRRADIGRKKIDGRGSFRIVREVLRYA